MIQKWYDPSGFFEWIKRAFSFLNLSVLIFTAVFIFSEFRFDWGERLVGSYLLSTNETRPEKGAVWEAGRNTINAHKSLGRIITRQENIRQSIDQADSFLQLFSHLIPGEWVTLEKEQFKKLYQGLPRSMAGKIIDPAQIVWLLNGNGADRIFCEGLMTGVKIYFVDAENRVIRHLDLKKENILDTETRQTLTRGKLEDIEEFSGRIYSADMFFQAAFKLPQEIIPDLIQDPNLLLDQQGMIKKVGIWNEADGGFIRLGFEFEQSGQTWILFVPAREWAVWQLSLILKGELK